MKRQLYLSAILLITCTSILKAQTTCPPFWNEIQQFKKGDNIQMPPKDAIVLVGSSSFTKWKDVQDYFPDFPIINRGFGGSGLVDVYRYAYDVILPYSPKQVIIYCGENDFASSATVKAVDVVNRFKTLFGVIRQNLPKTTIHYISMKPSPSRQKLLDEFVKANREIKSYLASQKNAGYIDVYDAMLGSDKKPREDIFVEDNLHMNEKGYRIWQKIILPYLEK